LLAPQLVFSPRFLLTLTTMVKERPQASLRQLSPSTALGSSHLLSPLQETVIGRDPRCQIVLDSHFGQVSRRHASIRIRQDDPVATWELCDLNSSNGTYLNGRALAGCQQLQGGDRIQLGHQGPEFCFELQSSQGADLERVKPVPQALEPGYPAVPPYVSAITAEGVKMAFRNGKESLYVLKGIDLDIKRGAIELLMGPSGSGKTTLLSILSGLLSPTAGSVYLLEEKITGLSQAKLAQFRLGHIGFIFQDFNLFPSLTALKNVLVALELKGIRGQEAKLQAEQLLDQVGLGNKLQALPRDLSGGQKQRVAIARALAGDPKLIMADEPTAALDSQSGRIVIELLRDLAKKKGRTVLMVTHDPRIVDIADRVTYLEDGMISSNVPVSYSKIFQIF
jgi:putative ABC transport system ATP-binding protein